MWSVKIPKLKALRQRELCDWLAGDKEGLNEMRGERVCGGLCTDGGYSISSIQTEPGVGGVDRSSWNVNNPSVDSRRPVCLPWCGQDAEFLGTSWKVCFNHSGFNNLAFWEKHRSYWALCVRFPSLFPEFTWVSSFFFFFFLSIISAQRMVNIMETCCIFGELDSTLSRNSKSLQTLWLIPIVCFGKRVEKIQMSSVPHFRIIFDYHQETWSSEIPLFCSECSGFL